ncbi:tRNA 2-selenouridine(34) synthase MnmH [Ideonella sp.]|uniref:tRNA 2-selenouridine(34) synthase MnmH n=1 Tax=Ideonella sp. TaxID=1929293 RepID=UPI003BB53592
MSLKQVPIDSVLAPSSPYDTVIDVRSPAEFADDHLPGAVNWPVLDDEERAHVGTVYKQVSTFEARKIGAALVSRRIADMLDTHVGPKDRDWQPLVYCWRGGQRSGSLSLVLAQVGFRTCQLSGGYKAFRARVRDDLATLPATLRFHVVRGRTGSGKTRLLGALAAEGAQVLDLEALAAHRGSVLGDLHDTPQPSQKHFETLLWQALRTFDPARPVFVESESRRIGARQLPDQLLAAIQAPARWIQLELSMAGRHALLMQDYAHFVDHPALLADRLDVLVELRGREQVAHWKALALAGQWHDLLPQLMTLHYDPLYDRQARRAAEQPDRLQVLQLEVADAPSLTAAARSLLA